MTRAQQYVSSLMENVSEGLIASDDHRITFAKIREKLADTEDFENELRSLYKVQGLSEFALSLMWVAERVEADPTKIDYDVEEQGLVVERYREAVGDAAAAPLGDLPTPEPFAETPVEPQEEIAQPEPVVEETTAPAVEETPEMPTHLQMETPGHIAESEKAVYAPPSGVDQSTFGPLIERFVEAMQSGSEERDGLHSQVLAEANALAASGSGAPADLQEFCQYLIEFLTYIHDNDFMDDVRVMNILSNVSSPVTSWAQGGGGAGLLDEGIEILKTFKSLFE